MDIWHTCEPETLGTQGWLGLATRDIDPNKENIVTAVSFGPSLFRALVLPGVPVACVDDLDSYGLLTGISGEKQRDQILDRFSRMYAPEMGNDVVTEYLGQTGLEAMKGADILKAARRLLVHHRIRRDDHRQEASGHRPGPSSRAGDPHLLLRPRQLR